MPRPVSVQFHRVHDRLVDPVVLSQRRQCFDQFPFERFAVAAPRRVHGHEEFERRVFLRAFGEKRVDRRRVEETLEFLLRLCGLFRKVVGRRRRRRRLNCRKKNKGPAREKNEDTAPRASSSSSSSSSRPSSRRHHPFVETTKTYTKGDRARNFDTFSFQFSNLIVNRERNPKQRDKKQSTFESP